VDHHIICVISVCSAAQVEQMLRVPYAQRQKIIDRLCDSIFYNNDSVTAFRRVSLQLPTEVRSPGNAAPMKATVRMKERDKNISGIGFPQIYAENKMQIRRYYPF
jgi:hypothetical protein